MMPQAIARFPWKASPDGGGGPSPDVYVFSRETVSRNIYQIPLP
jgi:hypothetical protein